MIVVRPLCEIQGWNRRMEDVLGDILEELDREGTDITLVEKASELQYTSMRDRHVLFAVSLTEAGVNMEYYRMLEYFRSNPDCLEGSSGGILVDGQSELFTKALARRLAFSANASGCTFPGRPLVEATGDLKNFHVLSGIRKVDLETVYEQQVRDLVHRIRDFGSESAPEITEISLSEGVIRDCRGCKYEDCLHFGEQGRCFYGGIITEQVYPALMEADALVMICPNYNDALNANLTAFINRLTALYRAHDFSRKKIYALVVSGYSGGDIVSEQIIGALNFNKGMILPGKFAMVETANDPMSILEVPEIDAKAATYANRII